MSSIFKKQSPSHPWRPKQTWPKFFFCKPEELTDPEIPYKPAFHYRRTALACQMAAKELNDKIYMASGGKRRQKTLEGLSVPAEAYYVVCQEEADGSVKVI